MEDVFYVSSPKGSYRTDYLINTSLRIIINLYSSKILFILFFAYLRICEKVSYYVTPESELKKKNHDFFPH